MRRNGGFSIIQVIISTGLLTGLIVAGFKIIQSQTEVGKSSSFYFESLHIVDEIKSILSHKKSCSLTLESKSAYFESIQNIISSDMAGLSEVEYRVQKDGKPSYGHSKLKIEKMELNGNSPEMGTEHGLTLLKISFVESGARPDRFSFEIPVHVRVNDMGRIDSCFTLAGINGGGNLKENLMAWQRSEAAKQEVVDTFHEQKTIHANASKVLIGAKNHSQQGLSHAGLSINGGLKIGYANECDQEKVGLISYSREQQALSWCNEEGQWEDLSKNIPLISEYKDFKVSHRNREVQTRVTENAFRFCQVQESEFHAGVCWVRPIKTDKELVRWELVSQYLRADQVNCGFRCFR